MPDNDALADRRRVSEEDYFRKRDRELIEKMRQTGAVDRARRELSAKAGVSDPALLKDLQELGFAPDTLALLPLVPIVQVAWAEGDVTPAERDLVVKLARKRGIAAGSAADVQLSEWLARRPSADVFSRATRLISALLASADEAAGFSADDLIRDSERIAEASGGILGLRSVSTEERAILEQISAALKGRKA